MKKRILGALSALMLFASVGFAAPVTDFKADEVSASYGFINYDLSGRSIDAGNLKVQVGLTEKLALSAELLDFGSLSIDDGFDWSKLSLKNTDFKAVYKISDEVQVFGGIRKYEAKVTGTDWFLPNGKASESNFLYGIGATVPLSEKLDAFGSWQKADVVKDFQLGLAYKASPQLTVYANYHDIDIDGFSLDGAGLGVSYKF